MFYKARSLLEDRDRRDLRGRVVPRAAATRDRPPGRAAHRPRAGKQVRFGGCGGMRHEAQPMRGRHLRQHAQRALRHVVCVSVRACAPLHCLPCMCACVRACVCVSGYGFGLALRLSLPSLALVLGLACV